jgi:hypothetical protein
LAQYISDISVHQENLQWQQLMAQAANFNGCASCLQQLQAELQSPGETSDVVKRILAAEVSGFEQMMVAFVEKANGVLTKTFANAARVAESDDCDVVKALTMTPPMSKTNFAKMWRSAGAKKINGLKLLRRSGQETCSPSRIHILAADAEKFRKHGFRDVQVHERRKAVAVRPEDYKSDHRTSRCRPVDDPSVEDNQPGGLEGSSPGQD